MIKSKNITPLLPSLVALALGIYLQSFKLFNIIFLLATVILCTILLIFYAIKQLNSILIQILISITFFALGAFLFTIQTKQHENLCKKFNNKTLNLIAQVTDKKISSKINSSNWGEILEIKVSEVCDTNRSDFKRVNFSLLCYLKNKIVVQVDDIIKIDCVKISIPQNQTLNENNTYQNYLIKEDLLSSIFLHGPVKVKILNSPKFSIRRFLWNIKNNIYEKLSKKMSTLTFNYFSLIFLGNTQHENIDKIRNTFSYWGISHYLARSGLHIILFILMWTILLRLIPISLTLKKLILILICLAYKLFSWASIPFTRAFYAFILTEIGKILNFETDFLHILSLICLLILLLNPMQLFFLDFQLTFALTFALALSSRNLF